MSIHTGSEVEQLSDVAAERLDVIRTFGGSLIPPDRLFFPETDADFDHMIQVIDQRKHGERQSFVALVDGTFDVPQPNHHWYLRHCRLLAARAAVAAKTNHSKENFPIPLGLFSDAVTLIVTVDADEKAADLKGKKPEKGGIPRPVYPWQVRAETVAGFSFDKGQGELRPVVDITTVEGAEIHKGKPLESALTFTKFLRDHSLLDLVVVYGEHGDRVDQVRELEVPLATIPDGIDYVVDPNTGRGYKSSDIIRKIRGDLKVPVRTLETS